MLDVEPLYAAFADQPRPAAIDACPHCRDPAAFRGIVETPLRLLDDDLLGRFVSHSGTVGSAADRHWLAPRLIELVITGQSRYLDVEQTLHAIADAGWATWPATQRAAGLDVLGAFWCSTLATYPGPYPAGDLLAGLSALGAVAPHLVAWQLAPPAAAQHLRDFVAENAGTLIAKGRLTGPYWSGAAAAEVIEWLRSPRLSDAVMSAFITATDPDLLEALDEVDRYLVAIR